MTFPHRNRQCCCVTFFHYGNILVVVVIVVPNADYLIVDSIVHISHLFTHERCVLYVVFWLVALKYMLFRYVTACTIYIIC
jgi:uncharacterized membrane protein